MSVIVSPPAHTWAASHRVLLALVAFAIAIAATVAIVLMTSAGSPRSSSVQAPGQEQSDTQNPVPTGAQNQGPADTQPRCLQYMPVRPC